MTVTISRLHDNHNDAQKAVRRLEFAGVPHSDISIVANNQTAGSTPTTRWIATAMASTIAPKGLGKAPALVRA